MELPSDSTLLNYEKEIFLDCFGEDGLLVMAKGLGLERIFLNFLKIYCDPGQLVLVLNTNTEEEQYYIEELRTQKITTLPKIVNNEIPVKDRYSLYLQGGVLFVSSRILVVDLLSDRVPVSHVTGILISRAQKVLESSQEAFILRLYRQKNSTGFVKAFTDNPHAFTQGFSKVERIMKNLFVRKLFLWPRFEASVLATFEEFKPEVVEMLLKLSPKMRDIQMSIMDLIAVCVKEIKRCNPTLDTEDVSVENAIGRSFEKMISVHLDPVWHQLSYKSKQLIADLKVFRTLLFYLTSYDCLSFYNLVVRLRTKASSTRNAASWLFLDAATKLYLLSLERVFGEPKELSEIKIDILEMNPKWKAVQSVLSEIKVQNVQLNDCELGSGRTLIFAADEICCIQLKTLLELGHEKLIERIVEQNEMSQKVVGKKKFKQNDVKRKRKPDTPDDQVTLTQLADRKRQKSEDSESKIEHSEIPKNINTNINSKISKNNDKNINSEIPKNINTNINSEIPKNSNKNINSEIPKNINININSDININIPKDVGAEWDLKSEILLWTEVKEYELLSPSATVVHPLYTFSERAFEIVRVLKQFMPRYVVLYDLDMNVVRQLEVHKATHPELPLRVYFVMYTQSVEEQRYLTTLRIEKQAFEQLIRDKASMALPEDMTADLYRDVAFAEQLNTRKGGMIDPKQFEPPRVIVDMREFRSELPSLIHRRGIDILPVTLEIGDYILTNEICVERKSVNDLIGSLNSGRLFSQATQMTRFYKKPVLLIEFDQNKAFSLKGNYAKESALKDVVNKLVVLTLHFPQLRILWCSSPYATAELFQELKLGRPEPDPSKAATLTSVDEATTSTERFNQGPKELLLKLPGVTPKNYLLIMNRIENISSLCDLEEKELIGLLENPLEARALHNFLHTVGEEKGEEAVQGGNSNKPKTKYRFGKKVS